MELPYLVKQKLFSQLFEESDSNSLLAASIGKNGSGSTTPSIQFVASNSNTESKFAAELAKLENHFDSNFNLAGSLSSENLSDFKYILNDPVFQNTNILYSDDLVDILDFVKMTKSNRTTHQVINLSSGAIFDPTCNIINVGYSRHNTSRDTLGRLWDKSSLSIGEVKADMKQCEPLIRDAKAAIIDMDLLEYALTGLTIFEACTIAKYLGHAPHLDNILIHGVSEKDSRYFEKMSVFCWYFLEGRKHRAKDFPQNPNNQTYSIYSETIDLHLEFKKSALTGRYWLKHPSSKAEYLSVSFDEYSQTTMDDIPQRLLDLID